MRPASATDTVETDTHEIDLSVDVIEARSAAARSSFDDRRTPTPPSRDELTDAWRASRHPMRSRVGVSSLGLWQTELTGHALLRCRARALSSRRAIARPTRKTSLSPFDRCAPTPLSRVGVVDRSAETAAFSHPVKGEKRASIQDVFHRTISPERRFVAEDALDAVASLSPPCDDEPTRRIPHLASKDPYRLAPI